MTLSKMTLSKATPSKILFCISFAVVVSGTAVISTSILTGCATHRDSNPSAPAPGNTNYSGLGSVSVTPETIAKFAPPPLEPSLSKKIQALMDVRSPGAGVLAPNGKNLFFNWRITGTSQIWRQDRPMGFPIQMTGGEDATSLAGITPDGRYILVSRDEKGEENPGLFLQKVEGGPLILVQHKKGAQTAPCLVTMDSKWLYFRSNDRRADSFSIYRYGFDSRKTELVLDLQGFWTVSDAQPDGRLLLSLMKGNRAVEFSELKPGSKTPTPLLGQNETVEYEAQYSAHAGELLVLTDKLGEFRRLYRWKPGKFTPITPDVPFNVNSFSMDETKTRILYTTNEKGYTRLHAMNARTFQPIPLPTLPKADHTYFGSTTPNGRFTTMAIDPGSRPPSSFVYDWKNQQLTQWVVPSSPEIDSTHFVKAELESYPARDGTEIPIFVYRSEKCRHEVCPVIVDFHGGPEAQSSPGFSIFAQIVTQEGFVLVQPNVRGSDGYGKTWLDSDNGPKRLDVITDIEDAALYFRKAWSRNGVTPRIGVMGGSYGGYSTLYAMTRFAGAYDAGVSSVGMSNLYSFLMNTAPYRRALRISEYGDPEKDKEALVKLSPMTYLDQLRSPLLIIQGVSDPRVPVGEALQIQRSLEKKKIDSRLILFSDEGHGAQKRDNRVLQAGHTIEFFKKHLR